MSDATTATTPIQVRKLGHMVYEVSDVERSTRFWTDILGFHVSDRNERGMVFLRNAADHHTIALMGVQGAKLASEGLRFNHLAMEVADMDALFKARAFLRERGVKIVWEGRKGPGGNPGVEFEDPDGYLFEIYAQMDQVGPDNRSRPASQWHRVNSLEEAVAHPLPPTW